MSIIKTLKSPGKTALLITALAATVMTAPIHARTWTNAEGDKSFEAKYIEHDDTTVTVIKSGNRVSFNLDLLSDADKKWLQEHAAEQKENATSAEEPAELGSIGKKLKSKLVQLDGRRFARAKLTKTPDYYLLYFTASW